MIYYWLILIIVFLILWIFLGGRNYEFIGLKPLFSHDPLPQDPLTINPFIMNHLKGNFAGSFVKQNEVSYYDRENEVQKTNHVEESSYQTFIKSNNENNKVPVVETKILNPKNDKKRVSELLHMNMPSNNKSKWKYQNLCCKILEDIYKKPFASLRPPWLKNPETGKILEIDCYNDELKIGIEYNGIQHYKYPNLFHKTYDDFVKQVRRDKFKHKKCDENGVYLITVPYNVPQEKIKDYILHYLPENVSRRINENNDMCIKNTEDDVLQNTQEGDEENVPTMTTYQEYLA